MAVRQAALELSFAFSQWKLEFVVKLEISRGKISVMQKMVLGRPFLNYLLIRIYHFLLFSTSPT